MIKSTYIADAEFGEDRWILGKVTLSRFTRRVLFTAVRGGLSSGDPFGDIAIDDVTVTSGVCTDGRNSGGAGGGDSGGSTGGGGDSGGSTGGGGDSGGGGGGDVVGMLLSFSQFSPSILNILLYD